MEIYLVMRNNLKRLFSNKITYIVLLIVPFLIVASGMISTKFTQDVIRVGIENQNSNIAEIFDELDHVQYENVNGKTFHADCIMGNYDYVVDAENKDEINSMVLQIQKEEQKLLGKKTISVFERQFAMLMTAYLVIATMYAVKCIADREQGVIERFCMTGKKSASYAYGYVWSTLTMVFIQVSIATLCFCLLEEEIQMSFGKAMLIILAISGIATIYGVVIALLSKRDLTANITAASFAVLASILGGTFVAVEEMPKILQFISWISPVRWILELL